MNLSTLFTFFEMHLYMVAVLTNRLHIFPNAGKFQSWNKLKFDCVTLLCTVLTSTTPGVLTIHTTLLNVHHISLMWYISMKGVGPSWWSFASTQDSVKRA